MRRDFEFDADGDVEGDCWSGDAKDDGSSGEGGHADGGERRRQLAFQPPGWAPILSSHLFV